MRKKSVFLVFLVGFLFAFPQTDGFRFVDTSIKAGLLRQHGRRLAYGGASIADLDGDGFLDLLLTHHDDRHMELYFGNGDGTFSKSPLRVWDDIHALTPVRLSPWHDTMHFHLSRGGSFGRSPKHQKMYRVSKDRRIVEVSKQCGIVRSDGYGKGRGRSAVFLNLRSPTWRASTFIDAVFINAEPRRKGAMRHFGFRGAAGSKLIPTRLKGPFSVVENEYASVTDIDGDGRMEVLTWPHLRVHSVKKSPFRLDDITEKVLPKLTFDGVIAVAEFDFDNDGLFDLYVARTNKGVLKWRKSKDTQDYLLKNMGGYYNDVTSKHGIPKGGPSTGVTAADFNNDGYTDLLLSRRNKPDLLLLNNKGKWFTAFNAGFRRPRGIPGDMATAADLDLDGRVDVVLSEGDWFKRKMAGQYRIMMNKSWLRNSKFLHVRVLSSPTGKSTSLHALVRVTLGKGAMKLIRRVGSPGTAVSNSYIETLHFGLGRHYFANSVSVEWSDGYLQTVWNVPAGDYLLLGRDSRYNSVR